MEHHHLEQVLAGLNECRDDINGKEERAFFMNEDAENLLLAAYKDFVGPEDCDTAQEFYEEKRNIQVKTNWINWLYQTWLDTAPTVQLLNNCTPNECYMVAFSKWLEDSTKFMQREPKASPFD